MPSSEETPTDTFSLEVRMDATITIKDGTGQVTDWLKPGSTVSHTWKGMPQESEVVLKYNDMKTVASVVLEDVIVATRQRLDQEKGK